MTGLVSLVGAGPGDPELLTLKALRRLQEADLVLFDALVSPEVVARAPDARRFCVGKRAGRRGVEQETINRLLVRAARRGQRVVRLKCGDPFLLGRGGEEALALAAAGVPFEVVPGVSSALAAPALSGVPVTHRGLSSGVLVVSGHAERAWRPSLSGLPPGSVTVVVLMGLAARAAVAQSLMERGWAADTPAAILWAASTPQAAVWTGPLSALGSASHPHLGRSGCALGFSDSLAPEWIRRAQPWRRSASALVAEESAGTLVVGKVVSLARVLAREGVAAGVARAEGAAGRRVP